MAINQQPAWQSPGRLDFIERDCPICGSTGGRLRDTKTIAGYKMRFHLCEACRCLYTRNPLTEVSRERLYGSRDFFAAGEPGGDNIDYYDYIGGERYLRMTARDRVARIRRYQGSGKLLEVACAAGFFLSEAKTAGFDVYGIEMSRPMAAYAIDRWGVAVTAGSIEREPLAAEAFDVIASWGVLTLLKDPIAVMRKFHRALKPGGIWAFNTYYHDGLWHKLLGSRWQHLGVAMSQVFTRQQLQELLRREGFQLLARRRDRPHTDVLKFVDHLVIVTGWKSLVGLVRRLRLEDKILRIPAPDNYEYLCRKV
jgi:2-polyprenyl-3-methyl-5-hydroxy-6-metoxy-1,4-benzoquinol methylase